MSLFEIVDDAEWKANIEPLSQEAKWVDIYPALNFLAERPIGTRIKIRACDSVRQTALKRRRLTNYAHRQGLSLRTYIAGAWIYAFTRQKFAVKSKERSLVSDTTNRGAGGVQPTKPAPALSRRVI